MISHLIYADLDAEVSIESSRHCLGKDRIWHELRADEPGLRWPSLVPDHEMLGQESTSPPDSPLRLERAKNLISMVAITTWSRPWCASGSRLSLVGCEIVREQVTRWLPVADDSAGGLVRTRRAGPAMISVARLRLLQAFPMMMESWAVNGWSDWSAIVLASRPRPLGLATPVGLVVPLLYDRSGETGHWALG